MILKEYYQHPKGMRPDDFQIPELNLKGDADSDDAYPFVYIGHDYTCANNILKKFNIIIPQGIYFSNNSATHSEVWEYMSINLLKQLNNINLNEKQLQTIQNEIYGELKELTQGTLSLNDIFCGRIWTKSHVVGIWDIEDKSKTSIHNCLTDICNYFGLDFNDLLIQYHINWEDIIGTWDEFIQKSDNEYDYTDARNIHLSNYKDKRNYLNKYLNDVYAHREQKHGLEAKYQASLPFKESIDISKIIRKSIKKVLNESNKRS